MAKRYTRKELAKPDEFVSFWDRAWTATKPYARPLLYGAIGAVGVLIAFSAFDAWVSSGREAATEQFDRAVRVAEADLITDENPTKSEDKLPRFKTEKDRAEAVLGELDKIDKEYPRSEVARRSQLLRAGTLFGLGRYPDAEAAYKRFLDQVGPDDPLRFLGREGIAQCAEAQGRLDEALAAYKDLEPKAGDFYRDRALYQEARVLSRKGDLKGAEAAYREILAKTPKTPLKDDVEARLATLGAPPPPAPAAPTPPASPPPAGAPVPAPAPVPAHG